MRSERIIWIQSQLKKSIVPLALVFLFLRIQGGLPVVQAQTSGTQTVVRVSPSTVTLEPEDTAVIQVLIENMEDLYGYEVHLRFNPALIQILDSNQEKTGVQVSHGDLFNVGDSFLVANKVDNDEGTIVYAITQLAPAEAVSGNGVLFSLAVQAISPGRSGLDINTLVLASKDGDSLPFEFQKGEVVIPGEPQNTPTPTQTSQPSTNTPQITPTPKLSPSTQELTFTPAIKSSTPTQEGTPEVVTPTETVQPTNAKTPTLSKSTPTMGPSSTVAGTSVSIKTPTAIVKTRQTSLPENVEDAPGENLNNPLKDPVVIIGLMGLAGIGLFFAWTMLMDLNNG